MLPPTREKREAVRGIPNPSPAPPGGGKLRRQVKVPQGGVSPDSTPIVLRRFQTFLLGLFSAIALVLAAVGIYGLIQYSVSQRTREIGVRMALGAMSNGIVMMVLRQGFTLAMIGLAAGMGMALLLSKAVAALLFGIAGADLTSVIVTTAILLITTLVACYVPARRAARIDPVAALRDR